jgi:hypothetical protein
MNGPGQFAIYFYFGVRHGAFEDNENPLLFPLRVYLELVFVEPFFVALVFFFSVIVSAKSFQLPVGWHRNFGPLSAVSAAGAVEIPIYGVVLVRAGEELGFGLLSEGVDSE